MIKSKILAVIPARGGSKGLPRKNVLTLGGKPLIAWTIESSLNSEYISKTIVSSEDDEVLNISKKYNADIIKRPKELANDTATSESVIYHTLKELQKYSLEFDYVVLLQPTSPLRNDRDIDVAFEKLFSSEATALISVCELDNKILKAFKENKLGFLDGISNNQYPFMRRQDLPKTYLSNGAIYIVKVDEFLHKKSFYTDKTIAFTMTETSSLDIDTKEDLLKVEKYIHEDA